MKILRRIPKQVFFLWLVFVLSISVYTLLLNLFGLISVKVMDLKELLFAVWGYGWDGPHYIKIALQGYSYPLQAFFPLYPLLIRFLHIFLPLTLAYRFNVLLGFVLMALLHLFSEELGFSGTSRKRALLAFLAFPTAFFLQANYTETLFIVVALFGLLFLSKKQFLFAAALAGVLTAIKISGLALSVVVIFSYIRHNRHNWAFSKVLLYILLGVSGVTLYFLYLHGTFGTHDIFFEAQQSWGRSPSFSPILLLKGYYGYIQEFVTAIRVLDSSLFRRISEFLIFFYMGFLLVKSFGKLKLEFWLYSFLQIVIPLSTGSLLSFNRLSLLAFPLVLWGANLFRSKKTLGLYVFTGILFQALGIYLFLNNVFVG